MSTSRFALRDKVTLRLLKRYFYTADVAECYRVIRLSDWCNSVSKVWIRISSRENKKYQLIYLILTLLGLIFRRIYIYVWKLNQTVLELDFRAVKFLFFPRRDLIFVLPSTGFEYIFMHWMNTVFTSYF